MVYHCCRQTVMSEKEATEANEIQSSLTDQNVDGKSYKILLPDGTDVNVIKNWTQMEEARARLKVDLTLLPLLIAGFFVLQLDRGNLSNALTSTLREDVGLSSYQINVGQQLLSLGIVIGEIPSNYVLQKIGPALWLPFQILVWGAIALAQGWIRNYGGYIATRFLLGIGESGFIPGGLYTLSKFYTAKELGRRHTIYFVGNLLASALSGLIAAGILQDLTGVNGWSGWRWLFFIEGVCTLFVGIVYLFLLPKSTQDTSTLLFPKWQMFNERERYILTQRLLLEDPLKALDLKRSVKWKDIGKAVTQWRVWLHFLLTLTALSTAGPINTYLPTIVRQMGYTQFQANAMSTIGTWISLVYLLIIGQIQDRYKPRAATIIVISGLQAVFTIVLRCVTTTAGNTTRLAILIMVQSFISLPHIGNTSWVSVNSRLPTDRAVHLALVVMAANCGGIYSSQILNSDDGPYFTSAFTALAVITCVCFLVSVITYLQYIYTNKELTKKYGEVQVKESFDTKKNIDGEGFIVLDCSEQEYSNHTDRYKTFRFTP